MPVIQFWHFDILQDTISSLDSSYKIQIHLQELLIPSFTFIQRPPYSYSVFLPLPSESPPPLHSWFVSQQHVFVRVLIRVSFSPLKYQSWDEFWLRQTYSRNFRFNLSLFILLFFLFNILIFIFLFLLPFIRLFPLLISSSLYSDSHSFFLILIF